MRRVDYLDTGPPEEEKQGADWGYKSQPDPPKQISYLDRTFSPHSPQQGSENLSIREQLELALNQLLITRDFLIEVADRDPDLGLLMLPASKISKAAQQIEKTLRPFWMKARRWWE